MQVVFILDFTVFVYKWYTWYYTCLYTRVCIAVLCFSGPVVCKLCKKTFMDDAAVVNHTRDVHPKTANVNKGKTYHYNLTGWYCDLDLSDNRLE